MSSAEERLEIGLWLFIAALIIGILIVSISTLLAVIKSPDEVLVGWVKSFLQFLVVIGCSALSILTITGLTVLVRQSNTRLKERIFRLERKFDQEISRINKNLQKNTPSFIAGLVILADAALLLADNAFQGNEGFTLVISLLMLIILCVANVLAVGSRRLDRIIGYSLYGLGFLILPVAALWYRNWNFSLFIESIKTFSSLELIAITLSTMIFLLLPYLTYRFFREESSA